MYSESSVIFSREVLESVERFVYDVIVYTLPKCGLLHTSIPPTDCRENVYNSANFIEIVGTGVLRLSLLMRNTLRHCFVTRYTSSELQYIDIPIFLSKVCTYILPIEGDSRKSHVAKPLAVLNEFLMFHHVAGRDAQFVSALTSTGHFIFKELGENFLSTYEQLFKFDDVYPYMKLITVVASNLHIPYKFGWNTWKVYSDESIKVVKNILDRYRSKQSRLNQKSDDSGCIDSTNTFEIADDLFEETKLALVSILTDDKKSIGIPNLPTSSEISAWHSNRLTLPMISELIVPFQESSSNPSNLDIEDDQARMSLDNERTTQKRLDAIPERKSKKQKTV